MQKTFDKKKFISQNSIWLVLIALVIIMSVAQPHFFSVSNLTTLLTGEAVKGIMAFGVMFAILSKGIDLTIGASAALVACITASLVQPADYANARFPGLGVLPVPVVIVIGLAVGAVIGAIYGAIIAYTKIPRLSQPWARSSSAAQALKCSRTARFPTSTRASASLARVKSAVSR